MTESVREFLSRREAELAERVTKLRQQLAPLEVELADVRRARNALRGHSEDGGVSPSIPSQSETPYARLSMKELTVKALRERFEEGATANDLLHFFYEAWDRRDILRSSLSPQLSRLKREGVIDVDKNNIWSLVALKNNGPDEKSEPPSLKEEVRSPEQSSKPIPVGSTSPFSTLRFAGDLLTSTAAVPARRFP